MRPTRHRQGSRRGNSKVESRTTTPRARNSVHRKTRIVQGQRVVVGKVNRFRKPRRRLPSRFCPHRPTWLRSFHRVDAPTRPPLAAALARGQQSPTLPNWIERSLPPPRAIDILRPWLGYQRKLRFQAGRISTDPRGHRGLNFAARSLREWARSIGLGSAR